MDKNNVCVWVYECVSVCMNLCDYVSVWGCECACECMIVYVCECVCFFIGSSIDGI